MNLTIEYPYGPVALNSPLYISRSPLEEQGCQEITKPGGLIRIRAPKEMGKSSLMLRIVQHTEKLGYHTVIIDCQQFDQNCLNNLDRFLRSFCRQVTIQLGLEPDLDEYWDEDIGSKVSCSLYFRWHLLEQLEHPMVLVLNEVNELFEYPNLTQDFLPLLRSWYEEAKQLYIWQKLRLIVVYTTEVYVPLKITQSPFNIGLPLTLSEFKPEQVEQLAQLHQLDWNRTKTEQLMAMVGGHPLLLRLAFYHLSQSPYQTLESLLKSAASDRGIYQEHLQRIYSTLETDPVLKTAFKALILANKSLGLQSIISYKLESLGLVKLKNKQVQVSNDLYWRYFQKKFQIENDAMNVEVISVNKVTQLEQENEKLKKLIYLDPVTQVGNRKYFDEQLTQQWILWADSSPLSLIMAEIDFFKIYYDYYGTLKGNHCLQQVAGAFSAVIDSPEMLVARYDQAAFVLLLPKISQTEAIIIAEKIKANVTALKIDIKIPDYLFFPETVITVSLGITKTIPTSNS
jgi:diguanylate cyclase (GGDEF)-like protein